MHLFLSGSDLVRMFPILCILQKYVINSCARNTILLLIRQETTTTVTFSKRSIAKDDQQKPHSSSTVQITIVRTVVYSSFKVGIILIPT